MPTGRIDSVNIVSPDGTVSSERVAIDFSKLGRLKGVRNQRSITVGIVVHHTAGPGVETAISALNTRTNSGLGYHYIVAYDGTIFNLVDPDYITFHGSEANSNTVSVSLEGTDTGGVKVPLYRNGPREAVFDHTLIQIRNAASLVKALMNRYGLTKDKVVGHGEVEPFLIQKQITEGGKSDSVDPPKGTKGRGKLKAEGIRVVQYIRGDGTGPSQATLDEIWKTRSTAGTGTALGGGASPNLPTLTPENYFRDTYIVPISGSGFGLVTDRIAIKEVKTGDYVRLDGSYGTPKPIQDVVQETALYAESQLDGELTLLRGVGEVNAQLAAETQATVSKIDGLLPAEAAFLVQFDLFEFNGDLMRKQMTVNAGDSNSAQAGDTEHAWRLPGKLAVTTTLLVPGVSGIRFGQVFRVGRTYEIFKKFGVFQTLGLTETISVNRGWNTEIYARLVGVPSSKLIGNVISG